MPQGPWTKGRDIKRDLQELEADMVSQIDQTAIRRRDSSSGTLNTLTPCAACKLLRRRCTQDCPFLPYFSPHEPQKFAAVHKIFGASNVSKLLMEVPESRRADAANSLVYEATIRLKDPIYGCMGVIFSLQRQVQSLQAELQHVTSEILKHKFKQPNEDTFPVTSISPLVVSHADVSLALPSVSSSSLYNDPHNSADHGDNYANISSSENDRYFG